MLNIAIVDDEVLVRNNLRDYIEKYFGGENCEVGDDYAVEIFPDGLSFLSGSFNLYDIVFMDIKMPMKNGLDVAREFRKSNQTACLIFVTNLAEMAIKGYEVNALDFIVKPISYEDFCYRMDKAVRRARAIVKDSIVVKFNRTPIKVAVQSIMYVETVYHKVIYHTITGDVEEWGTMRDAERNLRKYRFSRCNSGYLINLRYVDNVSGGNVYIGKKDIPISRSRRTEFMTDMVNYLGGVPFDN